MAPWPNKVMVPDGGLSRSPIGDRPGLGSPAVDAGEGINVGGEGPPPLGAFVPPLARCRDVGDGPMLGESEGLRCGCSGGVPTKPLRLEGNVPTGGDTMGDPACAAPPPTGLGPTAVERTHVVSAPAHLVGHTAPVEVGLLVVGLWHLHIIILTAVVGTLCLQEAQARGERR